MTVLDRHLLRMVLLPTVIGTVLTLLVYSAFALASLLRDSGYRTALIGKWHNGNFPAKEFDFGRSYSGTHWIKQKDGSKIHVTQKNENDALEFLQNRPQDKPFCLTLAFFATHAEDENAKQFLPQPQSMSL